MSQNLPYFEQSGGIALEAERDEFGHETFTLWIDGETYQITEKAWEKLQQFNFERFDEGKQFEQEQIIEIIEHCPRTDNNRTIDAPMLIALIKGETK